MGNDYKFKSREKGLIESEFKIEGALIEGHNREEGTIRSYGFSGGLNREEGFTKRGLHREGA